MDARRSRFDALYAEHYRTIYAYVYRRLAPSVSDVADVTADVFSVAWRRLDDVPSGKEEVLWLYGVAFRCVRKELAGPICVGFGCIAGWLRRPTSTEPPARSRRATRTP